MLRIDSHSTASTVTTSPLVQIPPTTEVKATIPETRSQVILLVERVLHYSYAEAERNMLLRPRSKWFCFSRRRLPKHPSYRIATIWLSKIIQLSAWRRCLFRTPGNTSFWTWWTHWKSIFCRTRHNNLVRRIQRQPACGTSRGGATLSQVGDTGIRPHGYGIGTLERPNPPTVRLVPLRHIWYYHHGQPIRSGHDPGQAGKSFCWTLYLILTVL